MMELAAKPTGNLVDAHVGSAWQGRFDGRGCFSITKLVWEQPTRTKASGNEGDDDDDDDDDGRERGF